MDLAFFLEMILNAFSVLCLHLLHDGDDNRTFILIVLSFEKNYTKKKETLIDIMFFGFKKELDNPTLL